MSSFFQPGQELDETGIKVFFETNEGTALPSMIVLYSLYFWTNGDWAAVSGQIQQAATASATPGLFFAQWDVPKGQPTGQYQVRWDFRLLVTDLLKQRRLPFHIVKIAVGTSRICEVSDLPDNPLVVVP